MTTFCRKCWIKLVYFFSKSQKRSSLIARLPTTAQLPVIQTAPIFIPFGLSQSKALHSKTLTNSNITTNQIICVFKQPIKGCHVIRVLFRVWFGQCPPWGQRPNHLYNRSFDWCDTPVTSPPGAPDDNRACPSRAKSIPIPILMHPGGSR